MKCCLFGGSFDPVHAGHLAIAEAALRKAGVQRVVFLPAARSPFKSEGSTLFTAEQRLAMLRAAVEHLPWAEVSEKDLQFPPPSLSWRLVEAWRGEHPGDELFWLMGGDSWRELHLWARPDYLAELVTFIVYHRGEQPLLPRPGVRAIFVEGAELPVSATLIRQRLLSRAPLPEGWLPHPVQRLLEKFLADNSITANFQS